jgi:hypothetical protein
VVLNKASSLKREWITVHDASLPIAIDGTVGVKAAYESERRGGNYVYLTSYDLKAKEAVTAVEVRFLVFNVWGGHIRTLSASEIVDIPAGGNAKFNGKWSLFSENEASEYYASIAYIARVRTSSGRVIESDRKAVLSEVRKLAKKFSEED